MAYREPGVIITQKKNTSHVSGLAAYLPVCVVGSGLTTIRKTFRVVKDNALFSTIRDESGNLVNFSTIVRLGNTERTTDYNIGTHLTDYAKGSQTIDGILMDTIVWSVEGTAVKPATGDTFYVEVDVVPSADHYDVQIMTSDKQVTAEYGPDVFNGTINNIALAAKIALENTSMVYVVKCAKAGATITAIELQVGLDKLKGEKRAYRIIGADTPADDLNLAILNHVRIMSDPIEGGERVTILAKTNTSTTASQVLSSVGAYANAFKEFRAAVVYPDKAKKVLSDGREYVLGGQFIAVALASMKAAGRPEQAYTAKQIMNFSELVGVRMSRAEKNLLAEQGVMILDQEKRGFPIEVRHGLSTDMSSLQMKEISVTELADYVTRVLRGVLTAYKGRNITKSLITMIEGSVNAGLSNLAKNGHILDGSLILSIEQLAESPDTIALEVKIMVPYPCNYINVVVSFE